MYSFGLFPRRLIKIVVCRRFGTLYQFHLQRLDVIQPLKMELIECSETSAYYNFNQTPGKYPKEYIHLDSKYGESLKSRIIILTTGLIFVLFILLYLHLKCKKKILLFLRRKILSQQNSFSKG